MARGKGVVNPPGRHSGMVRRTRPGIARFRLWSFGPPRNDTRLSRPQTGGFRIHIAGAEIVAAEVGQLAFQAFDVQPQRPAMVEQQ